MLRTIPFLPLCTRVRGRSILRSSVVESPRLEPPPKHHKPHTYHTRCDDRRHKRGLQGKRHPLPCLGQVL
jgi:hypothetical protein